jgi:hypothetical protein
LADRIALAQKAAENQDPGLKKRPTEGGE